MTDRVAAAAAAEIAAALTPEERLALVAGTDLWHTAAVDRLGVGAMRFSDGPNGVRGTGFDEGPTSACLPVGTALGATWDVELIEAVGAVLAQEARDKGAHVLLAPTLNLHRFPLAGRNFECFSEDPVLAARLAVAYIAGVQAGGVAATAKHFVANDSEHQRHEISSELSSRALREVYLAPFEAAVREAGVWAVMSAYNRLNGTHCASNHWLLTALLKQEWGFDGLVMSDWHGTYATVGPATAGLDLEMPGPPHHFGPRLAAALEAGEVEETSLADKARRVVVTALRTGAAGTSERAPAVGEEIAVDRPETWAFARRAAAASMVLLRNEGLLPLRGGDPDDAVRRIAIIGPNAADCTIMGGGSSMVRPHRVSQPLDALTARLAHLYPHAEISHEPGCLTHRLAPPLPPLAFHSAWWDNVTQEGEAVHRSSIPSPARPSLPFEEMRAEGVPRVGFSVAWTAEFIPDTDGCHTFGVTAVGPARVLVDGVVVADNWTAPKPGHTFYSFGSAEVLGAVELRAGQPVSLRVDYAFGDGQFPAVRVGLVPPSAAYHLERAVGAARAADLVVVVVGNNAEWETEGSDRVSFDLPGAQNDLVDAVLSVNRNTVVVVNAGAPVAMHWAERCPALVYAWYPGMAAGEALADVLTGEVDPGGRLPTTFPRRLEDHPAYLNYPGEEGKAIYGEGVFAGYRGFDARDTEPLFPFGHGLSYTTFDYGPLRLVAEDRAGHQATVEVDVCNSGDCAGVEVVQLYVADEAASVARPPKELRAFRKVALGPGESTRVRFELGPRAFAFWDVASDSWLVEPGRFELLVGRSSRDLRARVTLEW